MANALDAFNQGYGTSWDRQEALTNKLTNRQAGASLAAGDYGGAAGTLYKAGDLGMGSQVQNYGQAQEDRAAKQEEVKAVQELKFLKAASDALGEINGSNPQETERLRNEAFDAHVVPALKVQGANDDMIQKMRSAGFSNDVLRTFGTQIGKALEQYTLQPGAKRFDAAGNLIAEAPFAPEYKTVGEGQSLVAVGEQPQGAGSPGLAGAPRNERNNNPGNIEDGEFAKSLPGYKGSDGRFAIFESPEAGANAQVSLLQSYGRRGLNTIEGIVGRWAPASDGNDVQGYSRFVGQKVGVDPRQPLNMNDPNTLRRVADAMRQFEGSSQSASNPAPAAGGARVIAQGAPRQQVRDATPQELQRMGYPVGTRAQIDPKSGELKNIKQPTETEGKNAAYAYRTLQANDRMNELAKSGTFKPTAQLLISEKNGVTRIVASNPKDRQFIQAAKEWLAPILRKDTGAAVTDGELATYMDIYIPRPEDDIPTMRQKAQARQTAMIALVKEAGPIYGQRYGDRKFQTWMPKLPAQNAAKPSGGWSQATIIGQD